MFIVVGVTGGIAAYKAVQLVRLLVMDGHDVHVIPTEDALRFVGTPTWEAVSRNKVTTSVHDDVAEVRHVALGQQADLVVVAPATANTLAKMAAGLANDLLGTTLLATQAPVVVAPAMHTEMWRHPATQANVETLRGRGVAFIGPDEGPLTGGDVGPGRLTEPEQIHAGLNPYLTAQKDLADRHVVVSAGGTREPIDPVRFLGNRSSGRQGVAIAVDAARRGARVTLVACNIERAVLDPARLPGVTIEKAGSAAQLADAMKRHAPSADVIVMAAAVADYRVDQVADGKLTKEAAAGTPPQLTLVENEDILAGLVEHRVGEQVIVGFAAETAQTEEELLERGRRKRARKGCDLLAVNVVGWDKGFENPDNELFIIDTADAVVGHAAGTKAETAAAVLDAVLALNRA